MSLTDILYVRLPAGTKARIDAARGDVPQGAWVRRVIEEALARKPAEKPPRHRVKQAEGKVKR